MRNWLVRGVAILAVLAALAGCDENKDEKEFKPLFSDDFNRLDGALGSAWVTDIPVGSVLQIVTQRAEVSANAGSPTAFYPDALTGKDDQRISVEVIISGGGGLYDSTDSPFGIIARGSDSNRSTTNGFFYFCAVWGGLLQIVVPDGSGNPAMLASGTEPVSTANGDSYRLIFTLVKDKLDCQLISGSTVVDELSVQDDTATDGYTGLIGGDSGTSLHFDEFLLETR